MAATPKALLRWYDRNRRVLPWRAPPGEPADPYRVWLSEIMLQQTTVAAVAPYYQRFLARFPTLATLAAAPLDDVLRLWAGLGYFARARNLHACARTVVADHAGRFPADESLLRELPGIGAYTAAAVAAIAFGRRATPVDGNIERVIARLYAIAEALPAAKPLIQARATALTPMQRAGDFAQALMDLGATICTPKRPACMLCPWNASCAAFHSGNPEMYPRKAERSEGRMRRGAVFVVRRADDMVLVRQRPPKGLLGGMTELPTTTWSHDFRSLRARAEAPVLAQANGGGHKWRRLPGVVRHTFTHFPLELTVYVTDVAANTCAPPGTRWVRVQDLDNEALPSVMRKVVAQAGFKR